MPDYMVRLTHSYEVAQRVVGLWAMRCDKLLAYEHVGSKTGKVHIHLSLLGTNVDKKQLRNIANETKLPVSGNEWCSFKAWDRKDEYITYMSKGQLDPKYNKGYAEEFIKQCKDKWVEPHTYVKADTTDNYLGKFDNFLFEKIPAGEILDFYRLRTFTKQFCFSNHQGTRPRWDIKTINMYKMLMNTYIYQNNVKIPDDEKKWKW